MIAEILRTGGRPLALLAGDVVLVCVAALVALAATEGAPHASLAYNALAVSLTATVYLFAFASVGMYRRHRTPRWRDDLYRFFRGCAAGGVALMALGVWTPYMLGSRNTVALVPPLTLLLIVVWRTLFDRSPLRVAPPERWLIVGTSPGSVAIARELYERRQKTGIEIVGFIDPDPARVGMSLFNPKIVGTPDDIPSIVKDRRIDRVVLNLADGRGQLPMGKLLDIRLRGVAFSDMATIYEQFTSKIAVENLRPSWLIFASGFDATALTLRVKRLTDIVLAASGLVLLMPFMLGIAAAVRLTSPGPAIYRQRRTGLHGQAFVLLKFRSMTVDAEAATGAVWASANERRLTSIGGVLRRFRLDELPQLWNVLRGEMSLVGPRPERPEFIEDLSRQIPFYGQRHVVRPGLTGWAQTQFRYGASVDDSLKKLQYDLFYIKNLSLALDLLIVMSTIKTVLTQRGS